MLKEITPKVFIAYSWDDNNHKKWVEELATRLRGNGVNAFIDQWILKPGDPLPEFMERSVRESDFVLIICTPNYKTKSDNRTGGVGYEGNLMTAEVFQNEKHSKFIPILRKGTRQNAIASWLMGKVFIDFSSEPINEEEWLKLLTTLFGIDKLPPLGPRPDFKAAKSLPIVEPKSKMLEDIEDKLGYYLLERAKLAPGRPEISLNELISKVGLSQSDLDRRRVIMSLYYLKEQGFVDIVATASGKGGLVRLTSMGYSAFEDMPG